MVEFDPKKHVLFRGTPGAGGDLGANRKALREAVAEAQAQGKSVYIPNGEYVVLSQDMSDETLPPEMLPIAEGLAEVIIVCPSCETHWRPKDEKCPRCGRGIDEPIQ